MRRSGSGKLRQAALVYGKIVLGCALYGVGFQYFLYPNAIIVGWDVAVTAQGPVLIEGNAYPSVQIMQTAGMQGLKRLWNSALRG